MFFEETLGMEKSEGRVGVCGGVLELVLALARDALQPGTLRQ